jgi:hypothetical protein
MASWLVQTTLPFAISNIAINLTKINVLIFCYWYNEKWSLMLCLVLKECDYIITDVATLWLSFFFKFACCKNTMNKKNTIKSSDVMVFVFDKIILKAVKSVGFGLTTYLTMKFFYWKSHRYHLTNSINLEVAFKSSIAGEPAKHSSQREYMKRQYQKRTKTTDTFCKGNMNG